MNIYGIKHFVMAKFVTNTRSTFANFLNKFPAQIVAQNQT